MFRSSYLTLTLILVAACFNPVVSQVDTAEARKQTKSPTIAPPKCSKNDKASCIKIVMDRFALDKDDGRDKVSYGNGPKATNQSNQIGKNNPIKTTPQAEGTQWIRKGEVEDPDGTYGVKDDYFYYAQCTVLEGQIDYATAWPNRLMKNEKVACNIDICVGTGHAEADVPDCVFLKGLTKFDIKVKSNGQNKNTESFYAAIIGGLGRFTGSTGLAEIFPGENTDENDEFLGAVVELDASISPYYYDSERVEVPLPIPVLDTSMP